ncbi:hypothetical protein TIFTF001_007295 [Ficus carica]|uniref:Uncharacterized protein n=1 Tax=Ficus carica TaxID=3494 RepID=A0AA87ZT54_FICCA|nr:hypothetical protein TIFTF001_007295 [Ficus carica]
MDSNSQYSVRECFEVKDDENNTNQDDNQTNQDTQNNQGDDQNHQPDANSIFSPEQK